MPNNGGVGAAAGDICGTKASSLLFEPVEEEVATAAAAAATAAGRIKQFPKSKKPKCRAFLQPPPNSHRLLNHICAYYNGRCIMVGWKGVYSNEWTFGFVDCDMDFFQ